MIYLLFTALFLISFFIAIKDMKTYKNIYCKYKLPLIFTSIIVFVIVLVFLNKFSIDKIIILSLYPIGFSHFIIDLLDNELPDLSTIIIGIYGLLNILIMYLQGTITIGNGFLYLLSGFIMFFSYLIIGVYDLGGGDVKLIGALGLFFHLSKITDIILGPFFIGALFSIISLLKYKIFDKKKGNIEKPKTIPFGPCIIIAFILSNFF